MGQKSKTSLELEERLNMLQFIHDKNVKLIDLADNKATSILGINGLMLTVVFAIGGLIPDFLTFQTVLDYLRLAFLAAYLCFASISLIFSILTISPLKETGVLPPQGILYYRHIIRYKTKEEYAKAVESEFGDIPTLFETLTNQIYEVSLVDERKYRNISRCILCLFISFIMFIGLIVMMFIC